MIKRKWPDWWDWDLELSPHVLKRMAQRHFSEVDLRTMLQHARGYRPDHIEGRFAVETRHKRRPWEAIVEPDYELRLLVVITAYPVD